MKKIMYFYLLSLLPLIIISGCSSSESYKSAVPQYTPNITNQRDVYEELIRISKNVDKTLLAYSEITNAALEDELTYEKIRQANWRANYIPLGMERRITLPYEGTVRPILSELAKRSGYLIKFVGELPAEPLIVTLLGNETMVIDLLRDIDSKSNKLIDISIFDQVSPRIIEVRYVDKYR